MYDRVEKPKQKSRALGSFVNQSKESTCVNTLSNVVNNRQILNAGRPKYLSAYQRMSILSTGNPYEFEVDKADMKDGTITNKTTQDAVNNWSKDPTKIDWEYDIYDVSNNDQIVDSDNGTTQNPKPQNYGQRWDAGHSLGRQNGGLGDDINWVFPQNPQINRGNRFNGKKTYKEWRETENVFHNEVKDYGKGRWKIQVDGTP
jgi:hypothetical protein